MTEKIENKELYDGTEPFCMLDSSGNVFETVTMGEAGFASVHSVTAGTDGFPFNGPRGNVVATVSASGNVLGTIPAIDAYEE